jgi:hypothetical protein
MCEVQSNFYEYKKKYDVFFGFDFMKGRDMNDELENYHTKQQNIENKHQNPTS